MKASSKKIGVFDGLDYSSSTTAAEPPAPTPQAQSPQATSTKSIGTYTTHQGVKGMKTRRMNIAMTDDAYVFISREARKHGMTQGEYIYSLAKAAAEKKIELE